MTNGPDDQPGQEPPPPPPPPPSGGGRGLFARNDPDQPGRQPPEQPQRPPRQDPRVRPQQPQQPPQQPMGDDNPFLLPNERDRMPVYGAPPLPVVPLALMVLAIVVGAALFYMSQEDKASSGITAQQAASGLILHLDGVDMTEDAFRREIGKGIANGRIPCNVLSGQNPDNIAAGLRMGQLRMEVPNTSGVAAKRDQKADDASLLVAAKIVVDACPKGAAPAPQNPAPGGPPPAQPGGTNPPPAPAGTQAPGGAPPPAPANQTPAPAGTPRPAGSPAAPAATPRP